MPEKLPLLSVKILPSVEKVEPYIVQLIHQYSKTEILKDGEGRLRALTGGASIKLGGSDEDPLNNIKVTSILGGFYIEFDTKLGLERILKEHK
ncbi:hypothetical protein DRN87_01760 [Candidatus Geothermarchaeota archaeon]|nr:MAG: hypothetical protein DRN87_01760 [Candidatus Geothermarchaeota archaeon]HEW94304.1 hypothetical protein [Thermoprotei archaeon]